MATKKSTKSIKSTKKAKKAKRPEYDYTIKVTRAFDGKYGILFDMDINHVMVYGCRVCETKDGEAFVGLPQRPPKNKKDRYWSIVYCPFTDDQVADILAQVAALLDEDEDEEDEDEEDE